VTRQLVNKQPVSTPSTMRRADVTESAPNQMEVFGIAIDRDAEIPICVQLAWAVRTRIGDGRFKPGQRLPGLREVAEAAGINVNTVRAAYQRMEQEGLIDSQQGSGTFVAPTPRRPSAVGAIAANAAREAHATGVDPREVAAALYVTPESSTIQPPDEGTGQSEIDKRRALRTQIAAFERALGEIEAEYPGVAPAAIQTRRGVGPALLSAEELEQVRTQLVRRLSTVQAAIDEYVGESEPRAEPAHKPRKTKVQAAREPKRAPRPRTTARPAPAGT
jgi:DNA-binding transcriptional regulator YhcF (GntR family)